MQAPPMTCVLLVKTGLKGWQVMLAKIFRDMKGLAFSIDVPNMLMYLQGEVDPLIFITKLYKARAYAMLYRIDYGYEDNPEETRKPNSHFMRCRFEINTLEERWYKKIIKVLKSIQGVSLTIDAPTQMGYICGNIESGKLMKMLTKTGIEMLTMDYGVENKDAKLKPPIKELEAPPANGAQTQALVVTEPPPNRTETQQTVENTEDPPPNTSTVHQYEDKKKPRGFRSLCFS